MMMLFLHYFTKAQNFWRYERKFLPQSSADAMEARIRHHGAFFRKAYPCRTVNNIYLDTFDRRHYWHHIQGHHHRLKVRVRWYGELFGQVKRPVLEIKMRELDLGTKQRFVLKSFSTIQGFYSDSIQEVLYLSDLPAAVKAYVQTLKPVLANSYRRDYFVSADQCYRLTLDQGLRFYPGYLKRILFSKAVNLCPQAIVELKYNPEAADNARFITEIFPFRSTRFSKYVAGMEALGLV